MSHFSVWKIHASIITKQNIDCAESAFGNLLSGIVFRPVFPKPVYSATSKASYLVGNMLYRAGILSINPPRS